MATYSSSTDRPDGAAGAITFFRVEVSWAPAIGARPAGNIWFSAASADPHHGSIARITRAGVVTTFDLPHAGRATGITSGHDGGMWFFLVPGESSPQVKFQLTRVKRITPWQGHS